MQVKSIAECSMLQEEHSAILLTFNKQPFVIKIFVLSIFEWPFKTCFTALVKHDIVQNYQTLPRFGSIGTDKLNI